jgi:ribosomal protein L18E
MWGILSTLVSIAENVPAEIKAAEKVSAPVIDAVKDFLASPTGQQLEGWLSQLFDHSKTPDAVVVVTPKVMDDPK